MRNKAKILGTIIGILLFVTLMASITYAWYTWSTNEEEETLIATEVGTVTVKYDAGPSIIGKKIKPVSDKSLGIIKGITISADSQNVNKTVFDLYLDIKLLDDGLKHSSFKYELYESNNLRASGNFANLTTEECNNDSTVNHIVLLSEKEITMSISNYVLYIWIDGNEENPSTMQSQDFEFTLHAVGKNAIGDEALYPDITNVQEGTLAYKIVDDYISSENKTMVLNNNIRYYYDTNNSLMSDIAGNVRYYGNNPNNYIYFNCDTYPETGCETWRIIGVFDDKVKIIRSSPLEFSLSWDNKTRLLGTSSTDHGSDQWNDSRLMMLLNPGYDEDIFDVNGNLLNQYNRSYYWNSSGTSTNTVGCYGTSSSVSIDCYFDNSGITETTRNSNLIADTLWHLGSFPSELVYSDQAYIQERETNVYSSKLLTWMGKIALPYPSDYGYATNFLAGNCDTTLNKYSNTYGYGICTDNNWLSKIISSNKKAAGWFLSSGRLNGYFACYIGSNGSFGIGEMVKNPHTVTPVLHLNANTVISNVGNGSEDNPYRLIVNQ